MEVRRILSLDGGGIKGVFHVAFLAAIEERLPHPVATYFDLIAGTSTGGIVALGLGLGFTARKMLDLYERLGAEVFVPRRFRRIRDLFSTKYRPEPLQRALKNAFGDRLLGESRARLMIPSLNLETGEVHIYKTAHHPRFEMDYREPAIRVALATAAAPTYFPPHRSSSGIPLADGGLWANNPVGMAVVEAIAVLEWGRADLRVLSLGCPTAPVDVGIARRRGKGELYWARRLADVFMSGQSFGSLGTAQLLAGHGNVHRVCPSVPSGRFALDSVGEIASLQGLGSAKAREALPILRAVFFSEQAEPFEPYHSVNAFAPVFSDPSPSAS
jgi:hypothetical protein